jgi:hypothetical protein
MDDSKSLTIENIVVHGFKASLCLILGIELEISITKRLAGLFMEYNFSTLKFETLTGNQFIEIEVKEVFGKIANIQTRELVLFLFADWGSTSLLK